MGPMRIIADDAPTDRDEFITSSDFDVSFQHALCGIHDPESDSDLLAFLTTYLRSDLAKYYLFHTSSSWGIARPVVKVQELLRLPMPFPDEQQEPKHCREIVKSISKIIKDCYPGLTFDGAGQCPPAELLSNDGGCGDRAAETKKAARTGPLLRALSRCCRRW